MVDLARGRVTRGSSHTLKGLYSLAWQAQPLVLNSGHLPLLGGKELTPLPPQEEKSSSPSPLPTLGPLWGTNGDGDEAAEKEPPVAEGRKGG